MAHIILTGPTGFLGTAILNHILALPSPSPIARLTLLSRSPVPTATSTKETTVDLVTHTDYTTYPPPLLKSFSSATAIIWAQGISSTAVSAADYRLITYDYPLAAAKALAASRPVDAAAPLRFIYVSGEGATQTPGMLTQRFARIKGETELALLALENSPEIKGKIEVWCPRPGGIVSNDAEVWSESLKKRNATMRYVMGGLLPVYKRFNPGMLIEREVLAGPLVGLGLGEGVKGLKAQGGMEWTSAGGRVLQNKALRKMAGLDQ